jgi:hypothetical protein
VKFVFILTLWDEFLASRLLSEGLEVSRVLREDERDELRSRFILLKGKHFGLKFLLLFGRALLS